MKGPIKAVLAIYACASVFTYGSFFFFPQFVSLSLSGRLIWSIVGFSGLFLSVILVSKLFIGEWKPRRIGWVKENFSRSFLWVSALCFPVTLGNLVRVHVAGVSTVIESFSIGISAPYSLWLPLFAIVFWSFSGATPFSFLQAFPYESLREYPKKYILPSIALLFILLYNAPLVTGAFNVCDILWLGIIFLLIYHKFRNSLSLILAYVTLFEFPVLWCFGAAWGEAAFFTVLYARVAWSGITALTLVLFKLKGKMNFVKVLNNLEVRRVCGIYIVFIAVIYGRIFQRFSRSSVMEFDASAVENAKGSGEIGNRTLPEPSFLTFIPSAHPSFKSFVPSQFFFSIPLK